MLEDKHAYKRLYQCLGATIFDLLYTRLVPALTSFDFVSILLLPFLALASTVLFAMSHKDDHNEKDIKVTYILFICTTVLEFLFPCMIFLLLLPCWESAAAKSFEGWHHIVSQHNIMSFCVRKKKPTYLMKLATFKFLKEFINQHWYIQHVPIAFQITRVARQHVEDGWKNYIHDAASYKRFSELRGQWALRRHRQLG
jgi:hypothetical protein